MKQRIYGILFIIVFTFAIAGCAGSPDTDSPSPFTTEGWLIYNSYEELSAARAEAAKNNYKDDEYNLKGLDYYYAPAYAEERWEFTAGDLFSTSMTVTYDVTKPEEGKQYCDFLLWMSRLPDGKEELELRINPRIPYEGSPKLFEEVEGVYHTEPVYSASGSTYFYFICDNYYVMMRIAPELMDEINKNDPEALKGPLFELQKVELK